MYVCAYNACVQDVWVFVSFSIVVGSQVNVLAEDNDGKCCLHWAVETATPEAVLCIQLLCRRFPGVCVCVVCVCVGVCVEGCMGWGVVWVCMGVGVGVCTCVWGRGEKVVCGCVGCVHMWGCEGVVLGVDVITSYNL